MKRSFVILAAAVAAIAMPIVAAAHNAGHLTLPDGSCQEVGSFREAPRVGADRTQLDLVPQTPNPPRDEYGVSFVGFWGNTGIRAGACPAAAPVSSSTAGTSGIPEFAVISYQ